MNPGAAAGWTGGANGSHARPAMKHRDSDLGKTHTGAKQLFGDETEACEDMLEAVTGVRSSTDPGQAGLPDSCVGAMLRRMCSQPHLVLLQWATGKQLGNVIAAPSYCKKRIEKRAVAKVGDDAA